MPHQQSCHSQKTSYRLFGAEEFITSMTCRWSSGTQLRPPLNATGSVSGWPSGEGEGSGLQGRWALRNSEAIGRLQPSEQVWKTQGEERDISNGVKRYPPKNAGSHHSCLVLCFNLVLPLAEMTMISVSPSSYCFPGERLMNDYMTQSHSRF